VVEVNHTSKERDIEEGELLLALDENELKELNFTAKKKRDTRITL
jgi:hypothetical protein